MSAFLLNALGVALPFIAIGLLAAALAALHDVIERIVRRSRS